MLLTIDAGNTNVVFAVYDDGAQRGKWRIASDSRRTADEYAVWLNQLMAMAGLGFDDVSAAILASVVPAVTFNLKRLCRDQLKCEPTVIGDAGVDLGIEVLIENPREIGADRVVNAVAAQLDHRPPLIVIDFGTATTFDVVDANGNYVGGAIAPGIYGSIEALHGAAALLPKIDVARPDRLIGRSTVTAMQSGVFWGYIGMIEGMVHRIKQEFGATTRMAVIATGGLAAQFAEATDVIEAIDSELTLRGLLQIHKRNRTA